MSQCPHCRGLRKSRASHVKCECGDKPHAKADCTHPEKGDSKSELGSIEIDTVSDISTVDSHVCCCSHGARCSCALKKDHLDPVPETDVPELSPSDTRKPKMSTSLSDNSLTVFVNGHHKPTHKHNDAAHKCGVPYKIQRPHSIHGHTSLAQKKSLDNLPSTKALERDQPHIHDSIFRAKQEMRLVKSEHGSPELKLAPVTDYYDNQVTPLDLSFSNFNNFTTSPVGDDYGLPESNGFDSYFTTAEEQPAFSAGINQPVVDWSQFALPTNGEAYSATYSQPPSYSSFDHSNIGYPGLTTSSSGDVSDAEDCMLQGITSPPVPESTQYSTPPTETENYRLSSTSSYMGMPQLSMLASSTVDELDIDTYLKGASASPTSLEDFTAASIDPEAFTKHGITVQEAQKLAHQGAPTDAMSELSIPASMGNRSRWGMAFNPDDVSFELEDSFDTVWRS